ncbi:class I SAM-dependent methyltransferase, partial [Candidatus Roizmanbacteria bacterium]|nr:class I SAM-dependent methyltransferase [Candidatus Roizmanbacteria bacterium]
MPTNFYDKVAKNFGQYHTGAKYSKEYPAGDPEEVFKKNLLLLSGKAKIALDSGCADGRFTLLNSSHFKKIIAIDLSKGMLNAARKLQKDKKITNVDFEYMDVHKIKYPDKTFNVIYNRRGPTDYSEFHRLLKPEGHYLEIQIGEKDAKEIKVIFGRGQNFGEWNTSTLE